MADVVSFPAPNINQGKHSQWRDTNYPGIRAQATATPASISTRQSPWIGHEREWDLRAIAEEKKCCINRRLWQLLATAQLNYGRHSDLWHKLWLLRDFHCFFEPYGISEKALQRLSLIWTRPQRVLLKLSKVICGFRNKCANRLTILQHLLIIFYYTNIKNALLSMLYLGNVASISWHISERKSTFNENKYIYLIGGRWQLSWFLCVQY